MEKYRISAKYYHPKTGRRNSTEDKADRNS
jgi:hypothetical protein